MFFELNSQKSLEQIGKDLETAAARHKFGLLTVYDLREKMREKGIEMDREVQIFEVCNPKQAKDALDANPNISTVLPCRVSVYSEGDGYKLVTIRPTEMMKMFGEGEIERVAQEVENIMIAIMTEAAG